MTIKKNNLRTKNKKKKKKKKKWGRKRKEIEGDFCSRKVELCDFMALK